MSLPSQVAVAVEPEAATTCFLTIRAVMSKMYIPMLVAPCVSVISIVTVSRLGLNGFGRTVAMSAPKAPEVMMKLEAFDCRAVIDPPAPMETLVTLTS